MPCCFMILIVLTPSFSIVMSATSRSHRSQLCRPQKGNFLLSRAPMRSQWKFGSTRRSSRHQRTKSKWTTANWKKPRRRRRNSPHHRKKTPRTTARPESATVSTAKNSLAYTGKYTGSWPCERLFCEAFAVLERGDGKHERSWKSVSVNAI